MAISDGIMRLAAALAPRAHAKWAEAMRGEYAALGKGRTLWALGCLMAAARWRLAADGLYLLFVLGAVPCLEKGFMKVWFPVMAAWKIDQALGWYAAISVPQMLACIVAGAIWPKRAVATSLLVAASLLAGTYIEFWVVLHSPLNTYVHLWNRAPGIGEAAWLAVCTISVFTGTALARLFGHGRHTRIMR